MIIDSSKPIDYSVLEGDHRVAKRDHVSDMLNNLQARLKKLQIKEDEYNRNAAMVPESDPNVAIINDKILALKDSVEKISRDRLNF
jgi:hypothetical protein